VTVTDLSKKRPRTSIMIKDMVGRAAVLREVINTTVKPVMVSP